MQFGWEGAAIGEFLRDVYEAIRDGGDKFRAMVLVFILIGAGLAVIPLMVNSYIFFPGFISAPMAGQVTGDYDSTGNSLVSYKTADGESREYRAYAKLPKEKPVDICESAFGRAFLCAELQERKDMFQKSFLGFLVCAGFIWWFLRKAFR